MNQPIEHVEPARPATEYVEFWNDTLAEKFERFREILMNGLSYHSRIPLERMHVEPGSRIVDVGCGWGDTAIKLAVRAGPEGHVLGIDCVEQFLQKGRRDAASEGLANIEFVAADVERYPFEADFDLCFSRFGMMFFENPVNAMRNIHSALKPGGELKFIVWRDIADNPWLGMAKEVVLGFLPAPGEDARTCGPGPFSMSNPDVVTRQLEIAGFEAITVERIDGPVTIGDSVRPARSSARRATRPNVSDPRSSGRWARRWHRTNRKRALSCRRVHGLSPRTGPHTDRNRGFIPWAHHISR
jgi:ubiquinone/menaquinone biosynthesis C-methylase UbiE